MADDRDTPEGKFRSLLWDALSSDIAETLSLSVLTDALLEVAASDQPIGATVPALTAVVRASRRSLEARAAPSLGCAP